ncbi:alpha-(1,6)-fucosyltransferase [Cimex lectularius]|uniref:Alpha-(1,6)-fucosyltransferase n=1 Tax=Cimex lectularius TaxID=79782 RepID=A0A8I6TJ43_CIMLE|nr:alpha-(1,6)-fucosyltransferase [Cimex lectularius]
MAKMMRQFPWGRSMILLLLLWLIFLVIALGFLRHEPDQQTNMRISQALRDLQSLHRQREEISKLLTDYNSGNLPLRQDEKESILKNIQDKTMLSENQQGFDLNDFVRGRRDKKPSLEYEKLRRRLQMGVEEMWYFISSQVKQIQKSKSSPQLATHLNKILEEGVEHKRSLLKDVSRLGELDGFAGWRLKEAFELSDLVQRRISYLQNPTDCDSAKKLICKLNKGCGYGCQLHHAVYCLLVAFGTERTLILQSRGWRYNKNGWEQVFQPVSDTCREVKSPITPWPGTPNSPAVLLGIIDSVSPRPPYLPLAVPKDLAERIERLHGDPSVWWVGQFLKYLLRPQPATTDMLQKAAVNFKFQHPIVGVHIRRTDKVGTEAAFHHVEEYMSHVEEYFKILSLSQPVPIKRVYLASDDVNVFAEIKKKYPDYEVIGDPKIAKTAAVSTRYSDNSLNGIIMDIYFLSQSDYLVCTFSSQVCRVAYEIMQSLHPDAASRFRSLDDIYYYGGQGIHRQVAVMSHRANSPDQMDLEVGDIVGVAGNHWDGYSKGRNLRTNQDALYPSFKVENVVEAIEFPTYTEVPLKVVPEQNDN